MLISLSLAVHPTLEKTLVFQERLPRCYDTWTHQKKRSPLDFSMALAMFLPSVPPATANVRNGNPQMDSTKTDSTWVLKLRRNLWSMMIPYFLSLPLVVCYQRCSTKRHSQNSHSLLSKQHWLCNHPMVSLGNCPHPVTVIRESIPKVGSWGKLCIFWAIRYAFFVAPHYFGYTPENYEKNTIMKGLVQMIFLGKWVIFGFHLNFLGEKSPGFTSNQLITWRLGELPTPPSISTCGIGLRQLLQLLGNLGLCFSTPFNCQPFGGRDWKR